MKDGSYRFSWCPQGNKVIQIDFVMKEDGGKR